ncbi:gas vesicle protein [Streptomyces populi]|uniref:Gas vesicle protein n=1 Tax=Streptomyces populi TaxID=2058924 RepID=A0A2I0SXT6_9ACTN|nr:gas vesicle protein [Streptomyces populi]PKT74747.1 gas vesicle protein [Streptomyces populi]
MNGPGRPAAAEALPDRQIALVDLLDRLLAGGVVLAGDVVLSIADIDLVRVSLRALIVSVDPENPSPFEYSGPPRDGHDRR